MGQSCFISHSSMWLPITMTPAFLWLVGLPLNHCCHWHTYFEHCMVSVDHKVFVLRWSQSQDTAEGVPLNATFTVPLLSWTSLRILIGCEANNWFFWAHRLRLLHCSVAFHGDFGIVFWSYILYLILYLLSLENRDREQVTGTQGISRFIWQEGALSCKENEKSPRWNWRTRGRLLT